MEAGRPSETALGAAALRAAHLAGPGPYVFEDDWAVRLTGPSYRELAERGELAELFTTHGVLHLVGQLVGRARWAEEALVASLDQGVRQFVNLGAGLDSLPQRRPELLDTMSVFELDHPDTQQYKLARLEALGVARDPRVHYVPVDFERQSVDEALAATAFDAQAPCFVMWLGVVTYLSREDTLRALERLRSCIAPGSQIAMDYPIHPELLAPDDRARVETIQRGSTGVGEPRRATYEPAELRAEIEALGYACIEDLSAEEHRARYFAGRSDGLGPFAQVHLARFRAL